MPSERLVDIFTLIERRNREGPTLSALCQVSAEFLELDGASIVLSDDYGEFTSLCASNACARALTNLEVVLGEGPTVDASRGATVNEPSLLNEPIRWSLYTPPAIALGARAVFGYSIRLGSVRFGALSLYRLSAGELSGTQESDAFLMASVIGRAILADEAGGGPVGGLVGELDGESRLDFTVHQAAGMVAVQGSTSVRDALVSMRAHSFAVNGELVALASRILSRQTRFDPQSRTWRDEPDRADDER
jgi:hypothetical protein